MRLVAALVGTGSRFELIEFPLTKSLRVRKTRGTSKRGQRRRSEVITWVRDDEDEVSRGLGGPSDAP